MREWNRIRMENGGRCGSAAFVISFVFVSVVPNENAKIPVSDSIGSNECLINASTSDTEKWAGMGKSIFIKFKCHLLATRILYSSTEAHTHKVLNGSYFQCTNQTPRYLVRFVMISALTVLSLTCSMLQCNVYTRTHFYGFYFDSFRFDFVVCCVLWFYHRAHKA